jgi:hypothetical protein
MIPPGIASVDTYDVPPRYQTVWRYLTFRAVEAPATSTRVLNTSVTDQGPPL